MQSEKMGRIGLVVLGIAIAAVIGIVAWRNVADSSADASPAISGPDRPATLDELEERAEAEPQNSLAWQELAFARFQRGDYADAAAAYRKAAAAAPDQAVLWSSLGEALVMASKEEPLPDEALEAFEKALERDPADARARYFMAVRQDLAGDHEGAITAWLALLVDTPAGAPWEADLKRTIAQVGQINAIPVDARIAEAESLQEAKRSPALGGIPGPDSGQLAAASSIRPEDQREMALGMVASLEQKLAADPGNTEGWIMLMRSRMVLEQPDMAAAAKRAALAANPGQSETLAAAARDLGIP